MQRYILDTNIFFNMEAGIDLGKTTREVMERISSSMRTQKQKKISEFFMPPRIVSEVESFFESPFPEYWNDLLSQITVKSPQISGINFHSSVFYQMIEDIRYRSYRGLQVAEEEVKKAGKIMQGKGSLSPKDFQIEIGAVIKTLRDRYRQATRVGFLDSLADMDLISMAQEHEAFLVTTDEGVIVWGRKFGVREMSPTVFGQKMRMYEQSAE